MKGYTLQDGTEDMNFLSVHTIVGIPANPGMTKRYVLSESIHFQRYSITFHGVVVEMIVRSQKGERLIR